MNKYGVLYYPHFEPKQRWLLSTLLFVDSVNRIIPDAAKHEDSKWINELRDVCPDAVLSESPKQPDLWINDADIERMYRAFELIAKDYNGKQPTSNGIQLKYDFIHQTKIPKVVKELLETTGLLQVYRRGKRPPDGYLSVERNAGSLILSYVANRIARRKGVDATTDFTEGFAVNALENQGIPFEQPLNLGSGCLVAAIAKCQVPAEVKYLSLDTYKEVRESYSEVREAFKYLSIELAAANRLAEISDVATLRDRVKDTADEFNKRCDEYWKSRLAKKVKKWLPWAMGSLVSVATGFKGTPAAMAIGGKMGQVGFQWIDRSINKPSKNPVHDHAYQTICDLRERIIKKSLVKSLLHL